jgi:hypothetical protein
MNEKKIYKPNEIIYWELSNGDTWKLCPLGLGNYQIANETANCSVALSRTIDQARELVQKLDLTITEEI